VLAHWQHDGHADHDAVGRAAAVVCHAYRARLVEYLVTSWSSADLHDVPWGRARQLPLTPLLHLRKLYAISTLGLGADSSLVGDREISWPRRIHRRTGDARAWRISRARRAVCG
jgi:hypothetical protein